jgi:hypothetical protein
MTMPEAKPRPQPFAPSLVARVAQGLRYVATGQPPSNATDWFGPGRPEPAAQAPASVAGRAFDFPVAYNTGAQLRPYEAIGFADLRALADGWDLLRLVIETRKDQLEKLDWAIKPRQKRGAAHADAVMRLDHDARVAEIESFLRCPDQEHAWGAWLRLLLEDLFVIDAPTLYVRRDRGGRPYALEVVDGATIKRVLDESGRTPVPPQPAYRQILKGIPAVDYTRDELIYMPRNPRPHKVYGFSPVEQITLTVNIALRRALSQLHYYTEGNIPEALIGVPATWTPEQIRQFQLYWDSLMDGNTAERRHARFIPGDMRYQPTREPALKDQYDEWLARVVCYAFSVSPTPFVAQVNRATAESTHEAALEEGLAPLQNWVKRLVDLVLVREFDAPDLEFAWIDDRRIDAVQQAQIDDIYLRAGVKSVDEVRASLGLGPIGFANAVFGGPPTPIGRDVRPAPCKARDDVAKAGFDPNQSRVAAGQAGGGRWTAEGVASAAHGAEMASGTTRLAMSWLPPRWAPGLLDFFGLGPNSPGGIDRYVPDSTLPGNARFILQRRTLLPNGDLAIGIPEGYIATPSASGAGVVYRAPGNMGRANAIRIMPPDARYPNGRVIVYNAEGQPISPYSGRTGSPGEYHYYFGGVVPDPRP